MPLRSLIVALTLLAATALFPAALQAESVTPPARPLRVWVMHNEVGSHKVPVTERRIQDALEKWRDDENIIIENSMHGLLMPRELKEAQPFADYIIGDNQFLKELAAFQRADASEEPIAVEFIRWNDAYSRITSALASDDLSTVPDIVQIGSTWTAALADRGLLADVTGIVDTNDFFPPSIASAKIRGNDRLHAVPWFVDTRLLFYHKDRISAPAELETWERYLAAGKRLRDEGRVLTGFQQTITWDLLHNLTPWLWSAGGGIIDAQRVGPAHINRVTLDSPASIEAMTFLKTLATKGYAAFISVNQETLENEFIEGKYAAIFAGPWLMKRLGDNWQARYGISLPPAGLQGSFPFVGGSHLAISNVSKKRGTFQRAANLVRHLASPDSQMRYATRTGLLPANRSVLDRYLDDTNAEIFRRALQVGRSYPSIPAWGSIVENELTRSHIWQIWRDISNGVSDATLEHTAGRAASELREKVLMSSLARSGPYAAAIIGGMIFLGFGFTLWWRRRYTTIRRLYEQKTGELKKLVADRAILEGKALLLQQCSDEQSVKLLRLERDLNRMRHKTADLTSEIEELTVLREQADKKNIGSFSIRSDGTIHLDNEPVHFENNIQARRLIEHMIRLSSRDISSVHCLWGYALFGWDPRKLQTPPQRLFETIAAKINGKLKAMGKPPLLGKTGRKTNAWKFLWDNNSLLEHSDIKHSADRTEAAARAFDGGLYDSACEHTIAALELDPKNMDALALAKKLEATTTKGTSTRRNKMTSLANMSTKLIGREMDLLQGNMSAVNEIAASDILPRGISAESANEELRAMAFQMEYLQKRFKELCGEEDGRGRSFLVDEATRRMLAVQNEIASLKSGGTSGHYLWACVVDGDNFERLMAMPGIQSMLSDFYNRDTEEREDPRLIKLAFALMLTSRRRVDGIMAATSERDLFGAIRGGLRKELANLEQQLSALPATEFR